MFNWHNLLNILQLILILTGSGQRSWALSLSDISRSLVAATSSSRYTEKNIWIDTKNNVSYGVQVEVPENQMTSMNDINEIPVLSNEIPSGNGGCGDVKKDTTYGENDNLALSRFYLSLQILITKIWARRQKM